MPRSLQDKKAHAEGKVSLWGVHPGWHQQERQCPIAKGPQRVPRSQVLFQLFPPPAREEAAGTTGCSHWLPTAGRKGLQGVLASREQMTGGRGAQDKDAPAGKTPSFSFIGPWLCSSFRENPTHHQTSRVQDPKLGTAVPRRGTRPRGVIGP